MCQVSYCLASVFFSYCLSGVLGIEPHLWLLVSSPFCHSFCLTIVTLSLHHSICLFSHLCLAHSHKHAHMRTHRHTHLCFSWHFFPVISSNTTLSSCLITKQGHYICLHELPSLCGCVCVGVCEAYGHSLSHTQTHTNTYPCPLDLVLNYQSP